MLEKKYKLIIGGIYGLVLASIASLVKQKIADDNEFSNRIASMLIDDLGMSPEYMAKSFLLMTIMWAIFILIGGLLFEKGKYVVSALFLSVPVLILIFLLLI
jgi:hypothetical protein